MVNRVNYLLSFMIIYFAFMQQSIARGNVCTTEQNVIKECSWYSFEVQASALFLKPMSDNLHYAAQAKPLPLYSPSWNIFAIHPHFHCGFDLGFRTIFHRFNTNVAINWEHFKSSSSAFQIVPSSDMVGPLFEIGPDASAYLQTSGRVRFKFNEINLNYGQFISFGDYLEMNVFGGIGIGRLKQTLFSVYSNADGTIARTIKVPSTFKGVGPQFGLDFSYQVYRDFSLAGKAFGSLLVGTAKNYTAYSAISPLLAPLDTPSPNMQSTSVQNKSQLVPVFQEKIGVSYSHMFCDSYWVQLEAGYQAQIYLNALQSVDIGSEVVTPPVIPDTVGVFARTFKTTLSNFALAGPYLTLIIGF